MTTRRDFLKTTVAGAGALALGSTLPLYAAEHTGASFPKRFVFIRKNNGTRPFEYALPTFTDSDKSKEEAKQAFEVALDKHDLPVELQALEPYKKHLTILQGMSCKMNNVTHDTWHSVMALCNAMGGALHLLKRRSIDFELAALFPSPLGHVELSFAKDRYGIVPGYCVPAPHQTNFCYADPITAYENLFKCVLSPKGLTLDNTMLAHLQQKAGSQSTLTTGDDKNAYQAQVQSLGNLQASNKELARMAAHVAKHMPDRDLIYDLGRRTANSVDRQEAMTEVLIGALTSGLTNVVTYTIDDIGTKQSGLPGIETESVGLHRVGHNEGYGSKTSEQIRELIVLHHINQVKKIIDALKAQPEGNGTMFDNTTIMYFPEGAEKHHAQGTETPWLIMSGSNCSLDIAGRYIRLPYHMTDGHQTIGNWYTTILNAHGNPIKHYGDLDPQMARNKIPQEGAIKRFMRA